MATLYTCLECGTQLEPCTHVRNPVRELDECDDPRTSYVIAVSGLVRRLLALVIMVLLGLVLWGKVAAC